VIWLSRRPGTRIAATAVILAGTGVVLSGAAPAAGRQLTRSSLAFTCRSPSGSQRIPAHVAVGIPGTATARQPIRPAAPAVTVTLPRAYGRRLVTVNAAKVSVTAQVRSEVTENGRSASDPWILKTVSAAVPSRGDLPLRMTGAVQPVTEAAGGAATFTADGLSLLVTPRTATGAPATMPGTTRLDCTLNPGQTTTLATVPVVATASSAAAAPHTTAGHFLSGLWQSAPGGSFSGKARKVTLTDAATGAVIACAPSAMSGTSKFGQQLPLAGIGSFSSVTLETCTGPGGKKFTVATSASASHPWLLNAQSFDSASGVASVTISGVMATISGPGCSATVAGPSPAAPGTAGATNNINSFDFTDTLRVGPAGGNLHVWNVGGCSGLFTTGDALTFTATYRVTPSQFVVPADCPPFPVKTGFPFNQHFKFPQPPPGAHIITAPAPAQACAFIKGFSDVRKLGGAALVGPGFGNIQESKRTIFTTKPPIYDQLDSSGKLYYKPCPGGAPQCKPIDGLPPVRATFLSFGFMPTTATLQIMQAGTLNIASVSINQNLTTSQIQSLASIRVENVLINGAPLDVGTDCHTVKPFPLVLTGKPPYSLQAGGVVSGTITVPSFTGCGVGENLDPIFNATVSGPGNFVQLTQGNLCVAWNISGTIPSGCPAAVRKPVR
jgi:hypothetical protein